MKNDINKDNISTTPGLYIEQAGEKHIQQILKSMENVPWGITLLQLAWTAGPVTFLALQGGYYIGYGKSAPLMLFFYFAGYTLIAGLIGIFVNITYKITQDNKKTQAEKNFLYVIDKMSDLIIDFCNFRVSLLNNEEKKYEAACVLLKNSHPPPGAIAIAFCDITNDEKLAETAEKIEIFRRFGLSSRIDDLRRPLENQRKELFEKLKQTHPELSYFFNLRLHGKAPSLKDGIPRPDGFLERIFLASETDNLTLMTIKDAEALLTLVLEFMNGREITILNFNFTGNKQLRQAANLIEKNRALYRLSQIMMNYRTQALKSLLIKHKLIHEDNDSDLKSFYTKATECIDQLSQQIIQNNYHDSADKKQLNNYKLFLDILLHYSFAYDAYINFLNQQKQYVKAISDWDKIANSFSKDTTNFQYNTNCKGLKIEEKIIVLNNEGKLACAKKIKSILHKYNESYSNSSIYSETQIKQIAILIALSVNPYLLLSNPVNQYGIESSNAANLGSLEQGISVQAKAGWTAAMVGEVEKNLAKAIEKLVKVLIQQYGKKLDSDAIDFLHRTYGVNINNLKAINNQTISHASINYVVKTIPSIKNIQPNWLLAKKYAQNMLAVDSN